MERQTITIEQCDFPAFRIWNGWLLLTAGDYPSGHFNMMTVSWGFMGIIWNRPIIQAVVRPTRHTYGFMEKAGDFTLSAFPQKYQPTLAMLGSKSGRDIDKVKESGLTPLPGRKTKSPAFDEAELIIECRQVYFNDLDPNHFLADYIQKEYNQDYHRFYFGEVLDIQGTRDYIRQG